MKQKLQTLTFLLVAGFVVAAFVACGGSPSQPSETFDLEKLAREGYTLVDCDQCGGKGAIPMTCEVCKGKGYKKRAKAKKRVCIVLAKVVKDAIGVTVEV